MDMISSDQEGVIGNQLTSQGKNAILHRQVTSCEMKAFPVIGEDGLVAIARGVAIKLEFQSLVLNAL